MGIIRSLVLYDGLFIQIMTNRHCRVSRDSNFLPFIDLATSLVMNTLDPAFLVMPVTLHSCYSYNLALLLSARKTRSFFFLIIFSFIAAICKEICTLMRYTHKRLEVQGETGLDEEHTALVASSGFKNAATPDTVLTPLSSR